MIRLIRGGPCARSPHGCVCMRRGEGGGWRGVSWTEDVSVTLSTRSACRASASPGYAGAIPFPGVIIEPQLTEGHGVHLATYPSKT